MGFWDAPNTDAAAGPLTESDLLSFFEAVTNAPPHPCSLGKHVVSPKALHKPGWYVCGNCAAPVEVKIPLSER